jgi:hypothetical protein
MNVSSILQWLSENASLIICVAAVIHFAVFGLLRFWWSRALKKLQDFLESLLRNIPGTSDRRRDADLDDQIENFLQDVRAILTQDHFQQERAMILTRVLAKKEQRPYLRAKWFERWYNVARAAVEAYPLAGILGTILAMAVSLAPAQAPETATARGTLDNAAAVAREGGEPAMTSAEATAVAGIVTNFRSAIWSTFWGLLFAILFMGVNAWYEPSFMRLVEYRTAVREAIREAERSMVIAPAEGETRGAAEGESS